MADPALRQLDRDLPRIDMRSPQLRAKQRAHHLANAPTDQQIERSNAEKYARALIRAAREERARLVTAARAEASGLIEAARADAGRLVEDARTEVGKLVFDARTEANLLVASAERGIADLPPLPSVAAIIRDTAERTGVHVSDILGHRMARGIVAARREAMAAAYQQRPDLSLPQLAKLFGGRDHTTILHAVRRAGVYRGRVK
ncbi:hypothetical protein ASD64_09030 [Mesorhizobium sp. Root157]|uniref:helix-turn-helix domain-containing protein n=1 Tax=Mesorhizobium sp. Root157 TaxID=1736477 RepID=UPI0006FB77E4|nr:helix-turn-helix domain-containing protein [Mesorhizobium sp. Root157]KQZ81888.1 hypothetical protein ASD64_09030 [Mesorhizobium sp. Root157]